MLSLRHFNQSEIAQHRLEIIQFYRKYGEAATKAAFGANRKVISRWQQRLQKSGGHLQALVPLSTRPHQVRRSTIPPEVVQFIWQLREKYPHLGKDKIKPPLDKYCQQKGLDALSASTIGNVIRKCRLGFYKTGRVYHDPNSAWAQKHRAKVKRVRIRKSPKPPTLDTSCRTPSNGWRMAPRFFFTVPLMRR